MQLAIAKAKAHGIGMVAVRNSTHYGFAGYYALQAEAAGCIGITGTNARPSIAPTCVVPSPPPPQPPASSTRRRIGVHPPATVTAWTGPRARPSQQQSIERASNARARAKTTRLVRWRAAALGPRPERAATSLSSSPPPSLTLRVPPPLLLVSLDARLSPLVSLLSPLVSLLATLDARLSSLLSRLSSLFSRLSPLLSHLSTRSARDALGSRRSARRFQTSLL